MIHTVKVGDQFPDVSHRSNLLPVGSRINTALSRRGESYTQEAPRVWVNGHHGNMIDGYYLSIPLWVSDLAGRDEVTLPAESAAHFRWRIRDTALGAGERSGVRIHAIEAMCAEFGADVPYFKVGSIVTSKTDIKRLPTGSVVYAGHPDVPKFLNVWEIGPAASMIHLMGPCPMLDNGRPVTIHSMPGVSQVPEEEPADDEALARIALRAFRIGKTYQRKENWCSVYNNCLDGLGINDSLLTTIGVTTKGPGDTLGKEEVARMPEGTLLWHRWRTGQAFAVYVRDDGARGRSRTRRLFGEGDDGSNTHDLMTVVETPEEPLAWSVSGREARHFPEGSVLRGAEVFTLTEDRRREIESWHHYAVVSVPR